MRCSLALAKRPRYANGPRYAKVAASRTPSIDSFQLYYSAANSAITVRPANFRPTLSLLENFGETVWSAQRIAVSVIESKLVHGMLFWSRFAIAKID
ncbi:MAG: hypothetical protein F6K65_11660 [Moorea sp. SIO3C2]|nr:hypothetical protein [Moorena sp. SIO3C2]